MEKNLEQRKTFHIFQTDDEKYEMKINSRKQSD